MTACSTRQEVRLIELKCSSDRTRASLTAIHRRKVTRDARLRSSRPGLRLRGARTRDLRRGDGVASRRTPRCIREGREHRSGTTPGARACGDHRRRSRARACLAFNLSGHALHSIFWRNLSPTGGDRPDGELAAAIDEFFGSFEGFRAEMSAATATCRDRLGRAGLGSGGRPTRGAPVARPPHELRDHQHTAARLRRVGARLLPAVPEREGRLHRSAVVRSSTGRMWDAGSRRRAPDARSTYGRRSAVSDRLVDRVHAINWNRVPDPKDAEVWDRLTGNFLAAREDSAVQRPRLVGDADRHRARDDHPGVHRVDVARHRAGHRRSRRDDRRCRHPTR